MKQPFVMDVGVLTLEWHQIVPRQIHHRMAGGKMKTVHKHKLEIDSNVQRLSIQTQQVPILVSMQDGILCMWFEVGDDIRTYARNFAVHGTGHIIPDNHMHCGSVVAASALVWHVYEVIA